MKLSKSSIQSLKPKFKFNQLSSEKRQVEDVGRMASLLKTRSVVQFSGPDTMKFLQGLLTNDIRKFTGDEISSVRSLYAAMLTPQGRFLYDMFLYQKLDSSGSLLADVDSSVLEELLETLKKYRLRSKVDIENVGDDFSCWQRYGYGVHHHKRSPIGNGTGWQWHKDPRLDCLGFRGIFPSNTIPPMVEADTQMEEENYLMWRLEKGVAEGSIEIPKGEAIPLEYNLAGLNAISFQKGCYIGQELIARSHHRGVIRKRLIPLNFLDSESGKGLGINHTLESLIYSSDCFRFLLSEVSHKVAPSSEVIAGQSGKKAGMVSTALGSRGLGLLRIEEAFKGTANLVIKGEEEEDVKVEAVRPHWWPREWFLEHQPHQAAR